MTSQIYNQKKFIPTAPEKGSFPLDHESLCKKHFLIYASCLRRNDNDNSKCRAEAKEYLGCRMENNLMEKTEWAKLGFPEKEQPTVKEQQQ
ncbi:PREDICTED: cytochrome c oxidase assembly protein COX19 [Drosophila arizonae]|uniref:Cytochrome c oxidase assembly protein COX19 n=1 Tax=Drosophila arizonae TaxID=7263 RepID=A0ABM1PKL9_DROAR|nr:PREDICTED: cytochrome c oxidase assembly protein COX19 [Drosophila arizonae]